MVSTVTNLVDKSEISECAEQIYLKDGLHYMFTTPNKRWHQLWDPYHAQKQINIHVCSHTPVVVSFNDLLQMLDTVAGGHHHVNATGPVLAGGIMGHAQLPIFDGSMNHGWSGLWMM